MWNRGGNSSVFAVVTPTTLLAKMASSNPSERTTTWNRLASISVFASPFNFPDCTEKNTQTMTLFSQHWLTATTESFMDHNAIMKLNIPTQPLQDALKVCAIDGHKKWYSRTLHQVRFNKVTSALPALCHWLESSLWRRKGHSCPCIDYWGFNQVMVKYWWNTFPLRPLALEQLYMAKVITRPDLQDEYTLVWIKEGHEWKTVFSNTSGHFQYCVMPYKLSCDPPVFKQSH